MMDIILLYPLQFTFRSSQEGLNLLSIPFDDLLVAVNEKVRMVVLKLLFLHFLTKSLETYIKTLLIFDIDLTFFTVLET